MYTDLDANESDLSSVHKGGVLAWWEGGAWGMLVGTVWGACMMGGWEVGEYEGCLPSERRVGYEGRLSEWVGGRMGPEACLPVVLCTRCQAYRWQTLYIDSRYVQSFPQYSAVTSGWIYHGWKCAISRWSKFLIVLLQTYC